MLVNKMVVSMRTHKCIINSFHEVQEFINWSAWTIEHMLNMMGGWTGYIVSQSFKGPYTLLWVHVLNDRTPGSHEYTLINQRRGPSN